MKIRVLIIEDEKLSTEKLIRTLLSIDPEIDVSATSRSVEESIEILENESFDLIFSDIQLTDGLSFSIFQKIQIDTPVIFTTAYDQYAIEAFRTNSVDYLLKPIRKALLQEALDKFWRLRNANSPQVDFNVLLKTINENKKSYKQRFLVQSRASELKTIQLNEIAYFFADGRYAYIVCKDASKYIAEENLSHLKKELNPDVFFQINRKFIVHIDSIAQIIKYSNSRLKVNLNPPGDEETIVSAERVSVFKEWLGK